MNITGDGGERRGENTKVAVRKIFTRKKKKEKKRILKACITFFKILQIKLKAVVS